MNAKQVLTRSMLMLVFFWLLAGLGAAPAQGSDAPAMTQAQYPPTTELISVALDGTPGDCNGGWYNYAEAAAITPDGRYVAFVSPAIDLVDPPTSGYQAFVRDRQTGVTTLVSVAPDGSQANGSVRWPSISDDGRYVIFHSNATNLVPDDPDSHDHVFIHDRQTGQTTCIPPGLADEPGAICANYYWGGYPPKISGEGRYITYVLHAYHTLPSTSSHPNVYLYDQQTGQSVKLSVSPDGSQSDDCSAQYPSISAGGHVAYQSCASNLIPTPGYSRTLVYVNNRFTGSNSFLPRGMGGAWPNGASSLADISADGRYVAYLSQATNLVPDDDEDGWTYDVYVTDRFTGENIRIPYILAAEDANPWVIPSISGDGSHVVYVAYVRWANQYWLFLHNLLTGESTLVAGPAGSDIKGYPQISANGRYVTYEHNCEVYLYDRGGTTVLVQDEANQPVAGAQVFRNGELAGTTGSDGTLLISGLAFDDTLVARLQVSEWGTAKGHHSADADHNWAYRTYITSLEIPRNGEPTPFHVIDESVTQVLTLKEDNTLVGFNIVASVEWDATQAYLDELRLGFERASTYLYDASDGQMLFEQVTLYDNAQAWNDADYQVHASNQQWPQANVGVIPHGNRANDYTYLGRYFDGESANQGAWTQPDGYRTLIHEFGHYGLALFDSYFYYDAAWKKIDGYCTSQAMHNNATPGVNATLMDFQFNATEFAMQGVAGLWSVDCLQTWQYQVGGSDWETIRSFYGDKSNPARWSIQTPADHGGVVAGPTAIPVEDWSQAAEPVNVGNEACATPETLTTLDGDGFPIPNAKALVMRSSGDGRTIWQGKSGADGRITVLGAGEGDTLYVQGTVAGQPVSASWNLTCPTARALAQAEAIILLPDPFSLSVSAWPGSAPQAISVTVQTTATLSAPPEVFLQQTGLTATLPLTLTYNGGLGAYVGGALLDPAWPQAGLLGIVATDTLSQRVTAFQPFNLSSVVISETNRLWSPDGRAELFLAPGALSADGRLNISPEWVPGEAPDGMLILGSTYTIHAEDGLSLVGGANLSIFYEATVETRIRVAYYGAAIYRWDGAAWVALDSTYNTGLYYAAAAVDAFGTYALMTSTAEVTVHSFFLPIIGR